MIATRRDAVEMLHQRVAELLHLRHPLPAQRLQPAEEEARHALTNFVGPEAIELLAQAESVDNADRIVLDMDSSESPVHGQQDCSTYNGHFKTVCYHPLFLFNGHGDCLAAKLRPGNVDSANEWDELLVPEIERQQAEGKRVAFPRRRGLCETRDLRGACDPHTREREPGVGDRRVAVPTSGPAQPQASGQIQKFSVSVGHWTQPRRIVAKVEHHAGELFPRVGFIVTNLHLANRAVVRFYNKRGTAEQ